MSSHSSSPHRTLLSEAYALAGENRFEEARRRFQEALIHGPATGAILRDIAGCSCECGELEHAIAYGRSAVALAPNDAKSAVQLGIYLLLCGEYEQAWPFFDQRKTLTPRPMPNAPPIPAWDGQPLRGRGIVLIREQGLGDVLMCMRYTPLIAARGGQVFLDVQPPLRPLLARHPELGVVLGADQPAQISTYAYVMDLPRLLGCTPLHIPGVVPYLRGPTDVPAPEVLRLAEGLKVGLVWAGSARHGWDRLRSLQLDQLRPLLAVPGCCFFSLMIPPRSGDIAACGLSEVIHDLAPFLTDFLALAAVIDSLDLVISVDTAVCHLAGAMGKPVWTLLQTPPDWRWGLSGEMTPCYPSMRLFRQRRPQDWAPVLDDAASALRATAR